MPDILGRTATAAPTSNSISISNASEELRTSFAAARISFTWLGVRKSLSSEQKTQAAESFGAEGQYLSAAKKLLDIRHSAFQAVTAVRHHITSYWKSLSLPYPEPGIRLIKREKIESFNRDLTEFRLRLNDAVEQLDRAYGQLREDARQRLGNLYDAADYPASLAGAFSVEWDFPSVEPPDYLQQLNPELYRQEQQRMAARFDQAVELAEQAFMTEFSRLVSHLTDRLTLGADGERKVFRDSAIDHLTEFFQRFKSLNVRSNADLDRLVDSAQKVLTGVDPQAIRNSDAMRQQLSTELSAVQSVLDGLLIDQPRRRILRSQPAETEA